MIMDARAGISAWCARWAPCGSSWSTSRCTGRRASWRSGSLSASPGPYRGARDRPAGGGRGGRVRRRSVVRPTHHHGLSTDGAAGVRRTPPSSTSRRSTCAPTRSCPGIRGVARALAPPGLPAVAFDPGRRTDHPHRPCGAQIDKGLAAAGALIVAAPESLSWSAPTAAGGRRGRPGGGLGLTLGAALSALEE